MALFGILVVTCLAYGPSLRDPLLSDDYILIHKPASPAALWNTFNRPSGDGAMRPAGELVFGTYKVWAGEDAFRWHVLGLVLHLVNTALVYWLCFRMGFSANAAVVACALFALHAAHPEAVAWTSSTFDLLATLFVLLTLIALTFDAAWLAGLLTAVAILSKESAYALPGLAFLVLPRRKRDVGLYVCAGVALVLFIHRWQVFGGPGGYVDQATGNAQILSVTPLFALKALLYRPWWTLLTPIDWAVAPGLWLRILLGGLYASLAVLVITARRNLLAATAIVVALIPPVHLALIGNDLMGTRVFYLPSVFFCLWFARIPRSGAQRRSGRDWLPTGAVLLFSLVALRHNLEIRSRVAREGGNACQAAAGVVRSNGGHVTVRGLPRYLDGVFFFANGFPDCVRAASGNPRAEVSAVDARADLQWDAATRKLVNGRP